MKTMLSRFVLFACAVMMLAAACSSSSSSGDDGSGVASCHAISCDGDGTSCFVVGICGAGPSAYSLECTQTECTCSTGHSDGGTGTTKTVPYDSGFCPWGAAGLSCASAAKQAFAHANAACGWGLQ